MIRFKSFLHESEDNHYFAAGMVEAKQNFEFNAYNFKLRRSFLDEDDRPERDNNLLYVSDKSSI